MTKTHWIIALFCMLTGLINAQNASPSPAGARGLSMGQTGAAATDVNSIFSNEAGLGFFEGFGVTIFAEKRFLTSEINNVHLGLLKSTKAGTFGLEASYFGFSEYSEQILGLAYARKLIARLSIGAQIKYLGIQIPEYGRKNTFTFDFGLIGKLFNNFYVGSHVFSPIPVEITDGEDLPTILSLGFSYQISPKLTAAMEVEKDIDFDPSFKAGIDYKISQPISLRLGICTNPTLITLGFGINLKNGLLFDLGSAYHSTLGLSPGVGISYLKH